MLESLGVKVGTKISFCNAPCNNVSKMLEEIEIFGFRSVEEFGV
jgi:hypothetical protein